MGVVLDESSMALKQLCLCLSIVGSPAQLMLPPLLGPPSRPCPLPVLALCPLSTFRGSSSCLPPPRPGPGLCLLLPPSCSLRKAMSVFLGSRCSSNPCLPPTLPGWQHLCRPPPGSQPGGERPCPRGPLRLGDCARPPAECVPGCWLETIIACFLSKMNLAVVLLSSTRLFCPWVPLAALTKLLTPGAVIFDPLKGL